MKRFFCFLFILLISTIGMNNSIKHNTIFYSDDSYNGNIGLINVNTLPIILEWLKKWDIPYDEVVAGKLWPGHHGMYIDDRCVRPDEFLKYSYEELENICKNSAVKKES